jgi:hypothetical protein
MTDSGVATPCRRCGICCRKGGPALHRQDLQGIRSMLESRVLEYGHLLTLRCGEPVHDQVKEKVVLLESECVKISAAHGGPCPLYLPESGCAIYAHRPAECAGLCCQDTAMLARIASRPRLTRFDLIASGGALADLIQEHEQRCSCHNLLRCLEQADDTATRHIQEALGYDGAMRDLLGQRTGLRDEALSFLLGRPLPVVLQGLRAWLRLAPLGAGAPAGPRHSQTTALPDQPERPPRSGNAPWPRA